MKKLLSLTALGSLLAVLFLAALPARAEDMEGRIQALEDELARLKAEQAQTREEQMELKKEALAAKAKMPSFRYRKGAGIRINAADKSWGLRIRSRFHYRLMFWPDDDAVADSGFSQGDLALRRVRQRFNYFWNNAFYEYDLETDWGPDRTVQLQHAEFHIHFEKLNPLAPQFIVGPRVSHFFNRHDTNWSSSTGGFFDRSMFQDGAGIGAGSQNNGIQLQWRRVKVGQGRFSFWATYSNQGLTNIANQTRPNNDNRAAAISTHIEPFIKSKNKWLKGIDFSMGVMTEEIHRGETGRSFFRVRTTERQRLRLIEVNEDLSGWRIYLTPGFGWKVGPYWLRVAWGNNQGHLAAGSSTDKEGAGGLVRGRMWRVGHELFLWSPKGFLTGTVTTPGSLMFFTGFERVDYEGPRNTLRDCSSVTLNGECTRAHATVANVGLWYFIQRRLRVGVEWGHYRVNKIGRGGDDIVNQNGTKDDSGDEVKFNSLDFALTFDF